MARNTYVSAVEAYIDAELAAAVRESRSSAAVAADVLPTIVDSLQAAFARPVRVLRGTALLALLPALVLVVRVGLSTLPQVGAATTGWLPWALDGLTVAAAVWVGLVTLWQARNSWRRALGRAPATLRLGRNLAPQDMPNLEEVAIKVGVALATLPALLWLALNGSDQFWTLGALVVLPSIVLLITVVLINLLSGLGAARGVGSSMQSRPVYRPVPSSGVTVLDERISRLGQMREWLKDDHLRGMMDDVIGRQVMKSERRQIFYTVVASVLSLMAGWLLSAMSPGSALAQLVQR